MRGVGDWIIQGTTEHGSRWIAEHLLEADADTILRDHQLAQWLRENGQAAWNSNANRAETAEARIAELEAELSLFESRSIEFNERRLAAEADAAKAWELVRRLNLAFQAFHYGRRQLANPRWVNSAMSLRMRTSVATWAGVSTVSTGCPFWYSFSCSKPMKSRFARWQPFAQGEAVTG
jgi:hypothetical protein